MPLVTEPGMTALALVEIEQVARPCAPVRSAGERASESVHVSVLGYVGAGEVLA
jgi:hypothetical protein